MKPAYRATTYGTKKAVTKKAVTLYRHTVNSAKSAIMCKIPDEDYFEGNWRVTIFERRYRITDRCLFWKPVRILFPSDGIVVDLEVSIDEAMDFFWKHTATEAELLQVTR